MTKPQLGDTLFNRYTLIALLRDEPGVQAWKANDRVLARDCQVFILTAAQHLGNVAVAASTLGRVKGFTPVVQFRRAGEAAVLITDIESGLSLTDYLQGQSKNVLGTEAIRSIIGSAANMSPGPHETSTPYVAQAVNTTSPEQKATNVSIAIISADSFTSDSRRCA